MTRIGLHISAACAALLLSHCASIPTPAPAAAPPVPPALPWGTAEGSARLARATRTDFFALANQFESQANEAFCGAASATIVLNALRIRKPGAVLPEDPSSLSAEELRHLPASPFLHRYTQRSVFVSGAKTRAQVLGEPMAIDGKTTRDFGFQLRQLGDLLSRHGLRVQVRVVTDTLDDATVRRELSENVGRPRDFAVVNFRRSVIGLEGGGHFSPVGAYDAATDSFLVLDVIPNDNDWFWVTTADLARSMRTFDTVENRGYLLVAD